MAEIGNKPDWFKISLKVNKQFQDVRKNLNSHYLHTVCEEAKCPNIHECWRRGTATFMILGDVCTRSCGFCAVKTGRPLQYDENEPQRIAEAVRVLKLKHVVVTSVNRDELKDGGSTIWAKTISKIRALNPNTTIEVLTPDFKGKWVQIKTVLDAKPDIFSHNLETISNLYKNVRPQAKYHRSLKVLKYAHKYGFITKTGIMLGLGETKDEVISLMQDTLKVGVSIFTLGQYLQPSKNHLPVKRYLHPDEFNELKNIGIGLGFKYIESNPKARSSYYAEEPAVKFNFKNLGNQKNRPAIQ